MVIGSYVVASTFFYFFPQILHKNKAIRNFNFAVMSHRGGSAERTENTLEAFEKYFGRHYFVKIKDKLYSLKILYSFQLKATWC